LEAVAVSCVLAIGQACAAEQGRDPFGGGAAAGSLGGASGATEGGGDGNFDDDDDGTDGTGDPGGGDDPNFDVPDATAGSPGGPCGKVDFLFAIDNSGSMGGRQAALAASFPGFIAAIEQSVAAQDHHIMVVDSDAVATMGALSTGCPPGGDCPSMCGDCAYGTVCVCSCDEPALECEDPAASCDDVHGAGRKKTPGGVDCGVAGGHRYMTDAQPDLAGTFECLALVGAQGMALERPVTAAIKAITGEAEPGGCNDGFLRSDALLVVTLITDDPAGLFDSVSQYEDAGYLADAQGWYDAVVAAKGGQPKNVVMLGILDQGFGAPVFVDFVERFGSRGLLGDIMQPDYAPFFAEAVDLIDTACDEFEPAG
jgi:hypothetical protein